MSAMSVMERFREYVKKNRVPESLVELVQDAGDPEELLRRMDDMLADNEVELQRTEHGQIALGRKMEELKKKIKQGHLGTIEENSVLRQFRRMKQKADAMLKKINILDANVLLQEGIKLKLFQFQAMELQGVSADMLDQLAEKEQEKYAEFKRTTLAAEEFMDEADGSADNASNDLELAGIKQEIKDEDAVPDTLEYEDNNKKKIHS